MRAVVFQDGAVVCAERPDPTAGPGELLVKVRSAGLNGADLLQLEGHYPVPPGIPSDQPGMELAGTVKATGLGVTRFQVGDAVMGIVGGAAQAELAVIHERVAMPVPEGLGLVEAGGFPEAYVTAHDALVTQCDLRSGERVLVSGAAGGVGTAAVQLGRAIGARVTASVRAEPLRERVSALGARVAAPEDAHGHGPFDVVLELVGAPNLQDDLDALELGGRIAVIGLGGGARGELNFGQLLRRRARLSGSTMRNRSLEEKALVARLIERQVLPLVSAGELNVLIEEVFPLEKAAEAYERFRAGSKLGKIVLLCSTD
ncbi:MAG: quinone oxidoreductase, family [Acidimicrobiaceae bacterium]|nr:quinone oxidoreductase, family [Acidimicrobiaceae bacterium]